MSLLGDLFANLMIRRPARKTTVAELVTTLTESGAKLEARYAGAAATDANRAQLRHVIGIERWGQRRLQTLLGQGQADDEYDSYQPDAALDWPALRDEFAATRRETIALTRRLAEAGAGDDARARHNMAGELNAREWLVYLNGHATAESRRIR